MEDNFLESITQQFKYYKMLGDKTFAQLSDAQLFWQYNEASNSIGIMVKHLWGNMMSRWTDFLTSDGEKTWRKRDEEFDADIRTRAALLEKWEAGWACLFAAIESVNADNFHTVIYIRNMGHTVTEAFNRQLAHYAYHLGQIVFLGRMIKGNDWQSLSIPKGASKAYNKDKFAQEKRREHFTKEFLVEENPEDAKVKYDKIGDNYNQTRSADPYLTKRMLHFLELKTDGLYLDIGCGTGNYTNEFQKTKGQFIGIDPSQKMLDQAKQKNTTIDWRIGTAEKTGLPDQSVDGIIGSLTIHHWTDLTRGFQELHRVLKESGKLVIFTATPKQMDGYWLNAYFPKMLHASKIQMPAFAALKEALQTAGFEIQTTEKYFIQHTLEDLFLYNGKHEPSRYLDPTIRRGISSFSDLANQEEITEGLAQLSKDIEQDKIQIIQKKYANEEGDYLFIIAQKTTI
ncbi:MAG: DUF1572 family protein [Saprospiraceae bacterium]